MTVDFRKLSSHALLSCCALAGALPVVAQTYPSKAIRFIVPYPQGGRTGSRRMGCFWGGDGARPPGFMARFRAVVTKIVCACAVACALPVVAQTYPSKPIRFIVPFPPGGATDVAARTIAPRLADALGQQLVIDNRAGAGSIIGVDLTAKSPPDGYTMVMATVGGISINPHLYAKMPFDPAKDLVGASLSGDIFNVLVVHPLLPAQSVKALIALAKSRRGQLNFGSSGIGAADHLSGELFQIMTKTKMVHVAYKGGPPAMVDLVGGNLQLMFSTVPTAIGLIRGKKLNPLAITNSRRFPVLADVPTIAEAGVPGFVVNNWCGVFLPAATPPEIITRLSVEIGKAVATPDIKRKLLENGIDAIANTPAEFAKYIAEETRKWGGVIRAANVRID